MATEEVVVVTAEVVPVTEKKGDVSTVKKAKKVTKSKPKSPALHPPYFEMIKEAIVSMKERTGSSQYAIAKFIEVNQKNLPANFKKLLLTQLKKLVAGGKLVKVKASYKLPAAAPVKAKKVAAKPKVKTVAKKAPAKPKAKTVAKKVTAKKAAPKAKAVAKPKAAAKAKPKSATVKSKAKPKTPTKPDKVARTLKRSTPGKKAPVAKAIAAKKTPVKKAPVKSLKPKAAIAKKVHPGRKAKK